MGCNCLMCRFGNYIVIILIAIMVILNFISLYITMVFILSVCTITMIYAFYELRKLKNLGGKI